MTKGKASFGKRKKKVHAICRRCGRHSFHLSHRYCAYCGFGRTSKLRTYAWKTKTFLRKRRAR